MTGATPAPTTTATATATAGAAATSAAARQTDEVTGLINRIDWEPGSDLLRGTCHCGARHTCDDPVAMWTWLLAHPEGHRTEASDG